MDFLNWDLAVLSKAVAYSNLSGASAHVGLSQPQLSRIIAKLEDQFGVQLLDRDAKRKSSWTPAAFRLAEIYSKTLRQFEGEVHLLIEGNQVRHLRVASLEGMISLATKFSYHVLTESAVEILELHIYDLSELEERFFRGELDVIFSSREPGRKKYKYNKTVGYQVLDAVTGVSKSEFDFSVFSPYQYSPTTMAGDKHDGPRKTLVSNSLFIRQAWINSYGGTATIPSEVQKKRPSKKNEEPVLLLAQDHFAKSFWDLLTQFDT
jgi:hypothetical protein